MNKKLFYTLGVLVCLLGVSENAWAGDSYVTHLRVFVADDDTGKGLVYCAKSESSAPSNDDQYLALMVAEESYKNEESQGAYDEEKGKYKGGVACNFYGWAKPARGYEFNSWVGYDYSSINGEASNVEGAASPKAHTGTADRITASSWGGGAGNEVHRTVKATWLAATPYTVTYKEPVGGSYSVEYSYKTISNGAFATTTQSFAVSPGMGDKKPTGDVSYAADEVTLSSDAANFVAWEEDGVEISTNNPYTYSITKNANVKALFKWIEPVAPEEKLVRTTNNSEDVMESVVFSMENIISTWVTGDFTVTLVGETGSGTFTLGEYSYNATDKKLTIPFIYNANGKWEDGSSVTIQVAPPSAGYGTTASVLVKGIAQENSANQARVSGEGFATQEGDLTVMLEIANAHTDATLTLLQDVAVSSPLVVTKSMTLDLNNWVLSSTAANKIISVEGTDTKLTISDNSFLKGSEIQLTRSANAAIAAIEVTGANRLLYNKGKITVVNDAAFASNANAKAYGIYVSGSGNAVMQGGSIKVESDHDARGVYIASGNATLNVGSIEATAKSQAYALYSGGKINVAEGISLKATTITGSDASALYLTGGTAVVDNVPMKAASATNNAFGVNVQGGKLTLNGGTIAATAATPNVYGVYIAASGNVTIQQQAAITADGPGSSALPVFGVQNLGTLKLINSSVTATSTTNYATAVSSMTSATSTTIEGGTYTAQSATGYAYGLHHQFGTLNVDGGIFSAVAAGNNIYGARAGVDGTIANATILAESTDNGKTVYGFVGGVTNKNISLTNCTIKAKSATSAAYGIYSRANVTATGCELEAKTLNAATACGFYAENGTNVLNNTNATVESFTTNAYGINYIAGTLTVDGGSYSVTAKQATAGAAADTEVYGVKVADGKTANLSNASFTVSATNGSFSKKAYGAYTGTGTINSTGCTYNVSAATLSYGVFGNTSSTLNLQNNTIYASTIGTASARGIYSAGTFTVNGDDVTSDTKTYDSYPLYFSAAAHGEVLGGKFMAKGYSSKSTEIIAPINTAASASNVQVKGGFFSDNVRLRYYVPTGYDIYGVDPNAPEYAQKYYYTVNDHLPYENVCYITEVGTGFPSLEEAFDYARNHSGSTYNIIMTQPYTLPAGNYSLPANATLVVPDRVSRTTAIGTTAERQFPNEDLITENRCLTFAEGVNLDVYGMIEVSAKQYTVNVGRIAYVLGPYGRIHLENGSTVTLNSGAKINAWGYITGQGEIRVKNGAEVREFFQIHDMKAASDVPVWTGSDNKNTYKAFLMTQYYIQSIEAPTKYYYGGKLIGSLSITSNATAYASQNADNVQLVATEDAFFTVDTEDESAWVRKSYNPTTDRVLWETNSSASLGSIAVEGLGSYSFDSKDYTLPFTNNMTIHALSGIFNITQSTVLLPGSEVIIDKTATLNIKDKDVKGEDMGFYLYDLAQWGKYYESSTKYFVPAMYSPSWTNGVCPRGDGKSSTCLKDAAIYVKGKITVESALYTTAGGAAIYSDDENAGTIEFLADAAADGTLYRSYNGTGTTAVTAAKLRNGGETGPDANMTSTKEVAENGDTYAYANIDGTGFKWTRLKDVDGCIIADETDPENIVYYAKPQGYVAITSNVEDENHLFHSVVGSRLFIHQTMDAGCVWWEVSQVGETSVYYCASNDTYYEWGVPDPEFPDDYDWVEVKRTVTFYFTDPKSEDADKKKVLTVNYGAKPDVSIVSNPSKAEDAAATYQFQGWKYSETGDVHAYTATDYEAVTENGTYYLPVFTSITKKYTITLHDAKNGESVPVEVSYGDVPEYTATKAATAEFTYSFDHWEPALAAVTGPAEYTAYWTSVKNRYTITWMDGETELEKDENVLYGTATSYDSALPTKETDDNYVYAFSGWKSSLDGNTYANGSTPTVGGHTTYTAQYATTPRYIISFVNYDATPLQEEAVTQGERPVYDEYKNGTPARVRDVDGYYKFTGWKDLSGTFWAKNATLPVTDHKETYTAQYDYVTELYLITLRNVKGQGAAEGDNIWSGKFGVGSTPFYDPDGDDIADIPTKVGDAQYSYTFNGWSLTQDGEKIDPMPEVSGVATYWALFTQSVNKYTITFANVDGNGAEETVEVEYGETPVCPVTPAKGDNNYTYDFLGWDNTIVAVTGDATYTAQFSSTGTPRTFTISFEPENGGAAQVLNVAYGQMPSPTTPTKSGDAQYSYEFNSWAPALTTVTGDATYYAQYSQTVNRYTIKFLNYDGDELQSEYLNYGVTPSYASTPSKPMDLENLKKYTFTGWKNSNNEEYAKETTLPSVSKAEIYTAQYNESSIVASVTTSASVTTYYDSFGEAFNAANGSNGNTLKLLANITEADNTTRTVNKNMTIDLNGYMISAKNTNTTKHYIYMNGYTLTINDSRGGGKIYFEGTGNTNYYTVDVHNNSGVLTVNGGTIEAKNTYNSTSRWAAVVQVYNSNSTVNVYGGELIASATNGTSYTVKHDYSDGKVFVYGGKLKAGTDILGGTVNTSNSTLSGGYYSKAPNGSYTLGSGNALLNVRDDDPNGVSPAEYPYKVAPAHTVTFNNWNDVTIQSGVSEDGLLPIEPATPTKPNAEGRVYGFTGWSPTLATVSEDATYTAQYEVIGIDAETSGDEKVVIDDDMEVTTTVVETTGTLKVADNKTLTTTNLILNASEDASGQIMETGTITATNVYYDLALNTDARHWHAFGVPWIVDIATNPLVEVDNNGNVVRTLNISRDYEIMYYDGSERATNGASADCWKYLRRYDAPGQPVDKLTPGKGYMIAFGSHVNTVRFVKESSAPIIYTGSVTVEAYAGEDTDKGINAIANPMAYHASMNAGPTVGYVHDGGEIGSDGYDEYDINGKSFIVGKAVYVQVNNTSTVDVSPSSAAPISPVYAPARRTAKATDKEYLSLSDYYHVSISSETTKGGSIYVLPEEDKEDQYIIGHDLSKFGMSTKKPQIWIKRYDVNLGLNTTAPMDGVAEFPVNVYAPNAGEYTISLASQPDDEYTVYLLRNGQVIWDLSNSAYTVELAAGTDKTYGLRLSAHKVPTSVDQAVVDAQGETRKVIIEDKVYIIRGENVYSIDGQLVK